MTDKPDKKTSDSEKKSKDQPQGHRQRKWQKYKPRTDQPKKKDPEEIPILKYGPQGNFAKFKEAISKAALRDYGHLGKLIDTGEYYKPPEPNTADYDFVNDPYGLNKALFMEAMKDYRKELHKMHADRPKLYALLMQYLSEESLDEVKRSDKYEDIKKATEPRDLWNLIEETHKVNTISKVEAVTKLAARTTYQGMRQGPYETIIQYKERFDNAKKSYEEQGNPPMEDVDIAMDFFRGLDNNRYGNFKTQIMNDLTAKVLVQPQNLNEMYLLANQWVQVKTTTNAMGFGTTFTTTLDYQERPKKGKKNEKGKKKNETSNPKKEEKQDKDLSTIECYSCGENGHYAHKCPARQKKETEDVEERHSHLTWNASTFHTYQVNAVQPNIFGPNDVLLDNQANISIVRQELLRDIQDAEHAVKINGVGGHQFTVNKTGYLDPLFRVYASEDTHANILSLSEVEDRYLVTYVPQENFIVHLPETDIVFYRKAGMYVADWEQYRTVFTTSTSTSSTAVYTKAEEVRARQAYEFLRTSGFPSPGEAIHLLQDGNIIGLPSLTVEDLRRAYDLYGTPPEYVRGKMTKKKISRATIDNNLLLKEKRQALYSDVMHIDGQKFLVTTCEPLQLTLQCPITSESQNQLGLGLQGHLSILRSKGFVPTIIYTDPAKGFTGLVGAFAGVLVDTSGAGDNVPKVDAKIRRIKELYRCVKSGLPWMLPKGMVKDLVAYAVARINIRRTTALSDNVCPKVLFTGVKVNYKKELELAFGDYCEVYNGTDNTSASRSIPCIALYPSNNSTGSWEFMTLTTKTRVKRSNWKKMVTTELIVNIMNHFDERSQVDVPQELQQPQEEPASVPVEPAPVNIVEEVEELGTTENDVPDLVDPEEDESDDEVDESTEPNTTAPEREVDAGIASRTRRQTGTQTQPPSRYTMAIKVNKRKETPERKKAIEKADTDEIDLLFVQLRGLKPEYYNKIKKEGAQIYNSHMFSVEKFFADGTHDKFKSRLVFDGRDQDPELFPDRSSPTVALHSLMACLAIASANGITQVGKIDVKGAFIQTEMEGPPLYIRCDVELTKLIVAHLPGVKKYVTPEGKLYCRLLKALYGCIQASKLWFNKLTRFLKSQGYTASPTDPCVMRKIEEDQIFLLLIYVDDILVLADKKETERLRQAFIAEYQWITMDFGSVHSYLGMQIRFYEDHAIIDMTNFVEQLLDKCGEENLVEYQCPATKQLFNVDEKAPTLAEQDRKLFHTNVAKLLYLTKRARPDVMTPVGFLCTRVTKATTQDRIKLLRVLGYLKRTKRRVLRLKIGQDPNLLAYVDAAFATHPDAKSQTGITLFLGDALVFAASRKQKCVTKSPTDSELVALSDNVQFIELFAEFIAFVTNADIKAPLIYEDCTAVISLITEGGGIARTKHLRVRIEMCKQALREKKWRLQYVNTKNMIADGMTKVLEGEVFEKFADKVLGTSMD